METTPYRAAAAARVFLLAAILAQHAAVWSLPPKPGAGDVAVYSASSPQNTGQEGGTADEGCPGYPPAAAGTGPDRQITAEDLVSVRDFGGLALSPGAEPGFSLSPDGRHLAVQIRQANARSNDYCQVLVIYDLARPKAQPVTIAISSELARETISLDGLEGFPTGLSRSLTPQWSPDGKKLAFISRIEGHDRLSVMSLAGGAPVQISPEGQSVGHFEWGGSDKTILFDTDEPLHTARAALQKEAREGWRYDDRFWALAGMEPFPRGELVPLNYEAQIETGRNPVLSHVDDTAMSGGGSPQTHDRAWVATDPALGSGSRSRPHATIDGTPFTCSHQTCEDASGAWVLPGSREVLFARREGFALARTGVYRWRPGTSIPRRILITSDVLVGCQPASARLLHCGRERSDAPRDIVAIDLGNGRIRQIVDVNPQWRALEPASITRLQWTNTYGVPAIGDLVLPSRHPLGQSLPLVVVQYDTRGFLRGGTGDEYPIRVLAAQGFAVLSISRPMDYPIWLARRAVPFDERELIAKWMDRASTHDSILSGIEAVQKRISIDQDHVAITGLSDGASAAEYALIHSRTFSLALLSTCCDDPAITMTSIAPAFEKRLRDLDYPLPWEEHRETWREVSLAMNATDICAEVQIQAADREARMALGSIAALRAANVPIEMYVYPDEYHVKWQPAHRLAIYRRNLAKLLDWKSRPPRQCPVKR